MKKINLAILVSGSGTNLQAIIDAQKNNVLKNAEIKLVISNNKNAFAIQRANKENIKTIIIEKQNFDCQQDFENSMIEALENEKINLVALAGFMSILSKNFTDHFKNRILNIHPSLIPKYCGKGYYGLKVHQSVIENKETETGATVHFVNEIPDGGKIICQKKINVDTDNALILQKKVLQEVEWDIYPKAIEKISIEMLEKENLCQQ